MTKFFKKYDASDKMTVEFPFALSLKEDGMLEEDETHYYFEGYASTFGNIDSDGDVIAQGAFTKTLQTRKPKVLGHHDVRMPVGVHVEASEDPTGLRVKGKIPKDGGNTPFIVPYLKDGAIDSLSIGFRIKRDEEGMPKYDIIDGVRIIKEVELFEYSFVVFPANELARVGLSRRNAEHRYAEKDTAWDGAAAKQRILDELDEGHRNDAYLVPGCKHSPLIGDVQDGELVIVPRAVIQAAVTLGDCRLDEEQYKQATARLASLYEDLGMELPPAMGAEFDDASIKQISDQLRALGLSHRQSNALISRIKSLASSEDGGDDVSYVEEALAKLRQHELGDFSKKLDDINNTLKRK